MSAIAVDQPYVIAVDIGTTSTKTLVIHREGEVLASHSCEYPLHTPRADIAEQDPLEIFAAVLRGIGEVMVKARVSASEVLCVSFSSVMHSLIAVDSELSPITACITWADNRSVHYVDVLNEQFNGHDIYLRTGTPIHPMSPLLKLMWMKEHQPDQFHRAHRFMGIKEFVLAKLFGKSVIDYSIASATGMFNLRSLQWDEEALQAAGVSPEQLSEPVSTMFRLSGLDAGYAIEMGLARDTPFIVGASDGVLANLGVGAIRPGVFSVSIGTSGAVRGIIDRPLTDPQGRLFCYALTENDWVIGGPINNGGIMFRWVRDQLATLEAEEGRRRGLDPYDYLTDIAAEVAAGSDGLIFLPLMAGERSPYWNANARGMFFGLSLIHQKKHMIRAVLEGVIYRIHSVVEALEQLSGEAIEIRASGGFARSTLWCQMMADVLGTSVAVPNSIESSGLGAAQLGLRAMGKVDDFDHFQSWVNTDTLYEPNSRHHQIYQQLLPIYMGVYQKLKLEFDAIAAFQSKYTGG